MAISRSTKVTLVRSLLIIPAMAGFGWLGLLLGETLGYLIAHLTERDIAELKDMLIWCIISGGLVAAVLGVWLLFIVTGAGRRTRLVLHTLLAVVSLGSVSIMVASYDWPKDTGIPVIDYELRLPVGLHVPARHEVDLTTWTEKSGQGSYIAEVRLTAGRPEIAGSFVYSLENPASSMSLRLVGNAEGRWRLSFPAELKREKTFGAWQRIAFIALPYARARLPEGDYEIRYRVRHFM